MDYTAILPFITGPSAAVAVLIWWVWTLRKDLSELRRTIDAERRRADAAEEAARTANALIGGVLERTRR